MLLWEANPKRSVSMTPVSGPNFSDWQRDTKSFVDVAPAFTFPRTASAYGFNVTAGGEPKRAKGGHPASNFFNVLGVEPILGRSFLSEEDRPGGRPVVVVSESFWTRRFGRSPWRAAVRRRGDRCRYVRRGVLRSTSSEYSLFL